LLFNVLKALPLYIVYKNTG